MSKDHIYETSIAFDHEAEEAWVDTTLEGVAAQLLRRGFVETTDQEIRPYRRFKGAADQVVFRRRKGRRRLRGAVKARVKVLPDSIVAA